MEVFSAHERLAQQPRSLKNVVTYLMALDGSRHPALNTVNGGVVYDSEKKVYVVEAQIGTLTEDARREAEVFTEALKAYEAEVPKKYKTEIDLKKVHTVEEVVDLLDENRKKFDDEDKKGIWQKMHNGFFKLAENTEAITSWLELLPDSSEYLSLLCGGIKMILKAASRIGDVKTAALGALADIPYHLDCIQEAVNLFDKSEQLQKCGIRLYVVTLVASSYILEWFKERAIWKGLGAFLTQSSYKSNLMAKIQNIESTATRFRHLTERCTQQVVVSTNKVVKAQAVASGMNHVLTRESIALSTLQIVDEVGKANEGIERLRVESIQQHDDTEQVLIHKTDILEKMIEQTAESVNHLQASLDEMIIELPRQVNRDLSECAESPREKSPIDEKVSSLDTHNTPYMPSESEIEPEAVLQVLHHESDSAEKDLEVCRRSLSSMNLADQSRALWTLNSSKVRNWVLNPTHKTLIINNCGTHTKIKSPLTYVCARLLASLKATQPVISIHFFCGKHTSQATDADATPTGMLNSLLAQLLAQYPHFRISSDDLAALNEHRDDADSLARFFAGLIAQLPYPTTVFCIIDNLSLFEDPARRADALVVLRQLLACAEHVPGAGCIFKALVTSSTRMRDLPENVGREDVLNVPASVPSQNLFSLSKGQRM